MRPSISIIGILAVFAGIPSHAETPLELIDTRVGTAFATTATAGMFGKGSEEHGQTIPAVGVPHGMNLWTPQTRDTELKCIAPYYYADSLLQGFRNSHWINGGCTQDYGSMTLHAMSGCLRTTPEDRATLISHSSEIARPDYYSVALPEEGMKAEMTGLSRSAIFRFSYDRKGIGHLVVNPNSDEGCGFIEIDTVRREIRGYNPIHRIYQGWDEPAGYSGWFVVNYPEDLRLKEFGTFSGEDIQKWNTEISGMPGIGAYISYEVDPDSPIKIKAASSFTSASAALGNMMSEIPGWDFEQVRTSGARKWNERLSVINVEGGTLQDREKFYGSLYRCSLLPRMVNDADGSYPSFSKGCPVMRMPTGHDYYDDFSMWDTFRALHPLLTLIDPAKTADMMQSLVLKAEQGGWMPVFPCWNSYTAAMIGDHCAVAIADAAVKGIRGFDMEKAYRYLRRNAFETPDTREEYADGMGRRALVSYLDFGYIPLEDTVDEAFHTQEQSSRTLEYSFDDFALSQLASLLGKSEDAQILKKRSGNYKNVIDTKLGYANGRHADGFFAVGTDPFSFNQAFTEGAPCHYTWFVPHDPEGLITLLGGEKRFEEKLDSMFTEGRYWHGNEPCHQIPYLYDFVGSRDKAAKWTRHIMDTEYLNTPGGLSGNDDAGQMSAWFVFSAMGFYPVCPSTPFYYLGDTIFDRVSLSLPGGSTFTIFSKKNPRPLLNGKPVKDARISHDDILAGGKLEF